MVALYLDCGIMRNVQINRYHRMLATYIRSRCGDEVMKQYRISIKPREGNILPAVESFLSLDGGKSWTHCGTAGFDERNFDGLAYAIITAYERGRRHRETEFKSVLGL